MATQTPKQATIAHARPSLDLACPTHGKSAALPYGFLKRDWFNAKTAVKGKRKSGVQSSRVFRRT